MITNCPTCGLTWRHYGPKSQRECDGEHVYVLNENNALVLIEYPDFTDDQIRSAEVDLYRARRIDRIPDRRSALEELRSEFDQIAQIAAWGDSRAEACLPVHEDVVSGD